MINRENLDNGDLVMENIVYTKTKMTPEELDLFLQERPELGFSGYDSLTRVLFSEHVDVDTKLKILGKIRTAKRDDCSMWSLHPKSVNYANSLDKVDRMIYQGTGMNPELVDRFIRNHQYELNISSYDVLRNVIANPGVRPKVKMEMLEKISSLKCVYNDEVGDEIWSEDRKARKVRNDQRINNFVENHPHVSTFIGGACLAWLWQIWGGMGKSVKDV
jgi:hypothetical protein